MSKLAALHKKYEFDTPITDLHEPDPDCRKCHGKGEYPHANSSGLIFCMCLFVEGQSLRDFVAPSLAKAAKQALDAHRRGERGDST